ncbi:MAG: large conductance mechanosensitive channel protein MscL [Clostridia bacterium]|nr:large conductance mechanosensitive channel protein MscL [Clostridia bacterium]MBR3592069.1 large conductance mechanosensitive channel protein MscL [Clostridia bacterium]
MKKFLNEFKTFALRGNVIDLAVGVIIGGAFQTIVKSMVDDLIMPFVGLATGGINFTDQFVVLRLAEGVEAGTKYASLTAAKEAGATVFAYGSFITAVINFIIMAIVIFLFVKGINNLHKLGKKKEEEAPAAPTTKVCPFCKSEIAIEATRCAHCTSELKE